MMLVTAIFRDVSLTFKKLDEEIGVVDAKNRVIRQHLREILEVHYNGIE